MSVAAKKQDEQMTATALYQKQNKMLHRAFSDLGMPYEANKAFWATVIVEIVKRVVSSLSELNLCERSSLLNHLSMRGAKVYSPHVPRSWHEWKKGDVEPTGTVSKRPMFVPKEKYGTVRKIHAILADMKLPWSYVDAISKDRYKVDFVEWLNPDDLRKVCQMMVFHQNRNGGPKNYGGNRRKE